MNRISCPPLEIHVTHTCNLTCHGCNHYSNYKLPHWYISTAQFQDWIETWADKIDPSTFNILGGEPTLHPNLCDLLTIAARYYNKGSYDDIGKDSPICLTTNGSFLHRHPRLKDILVENHIRLFLSVHYNRPAEIIEQVRAWKKDGVAVTIYDYAVYKEWRKFYRGHGPNMEPFEDAQPRQSWKRCIAKNYFQLFEGKLWKCANIAYLKLARRALGISPKWAPYLAYKPLEPTSSLAEIAEFLSREDEFICNMCPSNPVISENVADD